MLLLGVVQQINAAHGQQIRVRTRFAMQQVRADVVEHVLQGIALFSQMPAIGFVLLIPYRNELFRSGCPIGQFGANVLVFDVVQLFG